MSKEGPQGDHFDSSTVDRLWRQPKSRQRDSVLRQASKVVLIFVIFGAAAIWVGERSHPQWTGGRAPAFWLEGKGPWAPDYGRCAGCGNVLIPRIDEVSAYRHCERCDARYRHPSCPKTIEEMERVWK